MIAVLFNRAVVAHRAEQWRSAAWTAVQGWQQEIDAIEALVTAPSDESDEDERYRRSSLHFNVLREVVDRRGGFGFRLDDEPLLSPELPFKEPSGQSEFLDHAKRLADNWLELLLQAFDAASEPEVASAAHRLRVAVRDPRPTSQSAQAFTVAQALCELVTAVEYHPNYRASQNFRMSQWDRFAVRSEILRDRFAYRRYRFPFR